MSTIGEILTRFQSLDTDKVIEEAFKETEEGFIKKQADQLLHGLRPDGSKIGKYKNQRYAQKKYAMNQLAGVGNVDLKLTGDFQAGLNVDMGLTGKITIESLDREKTVLIEDKYGDALGLGTTFKESYINTELAPDIRKKISNLTGLTFKG